MQRVKMMKKYADLLIREGLTTLSRQDVAIIADVEMHVFVNYFVGELYKMKARKIRVFYWDPTLQRSYLMNTPDTKIGGANPSTLAFFKEASENKMSLVVFKAENPNLVRKVPEDKWNLFNKHLAQECIIYFAPYKKGTLAALEAVVPTKSWSEALYPELTPVQGLDRLWQELYEHVGLWDERLDAEENFENRIKALEDIAQKLNKFKLDKLLLKDPAHGTDISMVLPVKHVWSTSLRELGDKNEFFLSTVPDFRVFTAPHSHGAHGVIHSSLPFSYEGKELDGVSLTFENGKVTKASAKKGQDILEEILKKDEFAVRLGEIALVNQDAFGTRRGNFFGDGILDENSTTHIALGQASYRSFDGGYGLTSQELQSHGLNQSTVHFDIPIGSDTLVVMGETEGGKRYKIMEKGQFAL